MKLFIASDIHGSAYYCGKMLEAYRREQAGRMILLGDILYHGPRNDLPKEYSPRDVAAMLNPLKNEICCVRGNCDTEVDQMVLEFPILADYALIPLVDRAIFLTHGHVYNIGNLPQIGSGDILLYGHTHVPICEEREGRICMNPGSISIPKDGSGHSYMTFEDGYFEWKSINGETYMARRV